MTTLAIGPYRLIVMYLFRPKGRNNWHYRRVVPTDLREQYGASQILKSLKTSDEAEALKRCATYNQQVEQDFKRYRNQEPSTLTLENLNEAERLLRQHNLVARAWAVSDPLDYDASEEATINRQSEGLQDHIEVIVQSKLSPEAYERFYFEHQDPLPYLPPQNKWHY